MSDASPISFKTPNELSLTVFNTRFQTWSLFLWLVREKSLREVDMGNSLGGKKTTKIMKIDGESFKLKTPVTAEEVLKDFPGHVLLESESVKHYGARAKPLEVCGFLYQTIIRYMFWWINQKVYNLVACRRRRGWWQSGCISWWSRWRSVHRREG